MRVWQIGLIYKIKCMGSKGDLLNLIEPFERQKIAFLNEQESE